MNEEDRGLLKDLAGETLFIGTMISTLWALLSSAGAIPTDKTRELIDHQLLMFEKQQQAGHVDPEIVEHVRRRMEALLRLTAKERPS